MKELEEERNILKTIHIHNIVTLTSPHTLPSYLSPLLPLSPPPLSLHTNPFNESNPSPLIVLASSDSTSSTMLARSLELRSVVGTQYILEDWRERGGRRRGERGGGERERLMTEGINNVQYM